MIFRFFDEYLTEVKKDTGLMTGETVSRTVLTEDEMGGLSCLFHHNTLMPGGTFKPHRHWNGGEIYYILSGELTTGAPGKERILRKGDVCCTQENDIHDARNDGSKPVEFLAIVLGQGRWEGV